MLRMSGFGILQHPLAERTIPGDHQRPLTTAGLQEPQGFDFEGGVEEDFEIIEDDNGAGGVGNEFPQQRSHVPWALSAGVFEEPATEFEVDVHEGAGVGCCKLLQQGRFSASWRCSDDYQLVVEGSGLLDCLLKFEHGARGVKRGDLVQGELVQGELSALDGRWG